MDAGVRLIDLRHLFLEHLLLRGRHLLVRTLDIPLLLLLEPPVRGVLHFDGRIPQRDEFRFVNIGQRGQNTHLLQISL